MARKTKVIAALSLVALAGSAVSAAPFSWLGGEGNWSDHLKWFGPAGLTPSTINDTASINGSTSTATLTGNVAIGGLSITNSADVRLAGFSLFVAGDTLLSGGFAGISVSDGPALRDFDTDVLTLTNGGRVYMNGGTMQIDEAVSASTDSGITGVGVIEMNSTTGHFDVGTGSVSAFPSGSLANATLTLRRTNTSTSRLDWTDPAARVTAWANARLVNELPYAGPLGGRLYIGNEGEFDSAQGFFGTASSEIVMQAADVQGESATLIAPWIDHAGELSVLGTAVIHAPLVALRGPINIDSTGHPALQLWIPSDLTQLNAVNITSVGNFCVVTPGRFNLSVTGGLTTVDLAGNSIFNLAGATGDLDVSIASNSTLDVDAWRLSLAPSDRLTGDLDIAGDLIIRERPGHQPWESAGVMTLANGSVAGRDLDNTGTIQGRGEFLGWVENTGIIEAQNGALYFRGGLDMGDGAGVGVVRAVNGDISIDSVGFDDIFGGSLEVGNGSGVHEVFEMDESLTMLSSSTLVLNSGFMRADSFAFAGQFTALGSSEIRATGVSQFSAINLGTTLDATIMGDLALRGPVRVRASAAFAGEGTIAAVGLPDFIDLENGTNLADVSLVVENRLEVSRAFDADASGVASVASLDLAPTAAYHADLGGANPGDSDRIVALDNASLAGTLVLAPATGQVLPIPSTYTIVQAGSVSGEFSEVDTSALGANRRAFVTYSATEVQVTVTCLADFALPIGQLTFADVSAFLAAFTQGDQSADLVVPFGSFTFADINAFLASFSNGCP